MSFSSRHITIGKLNGVAAVSKEKQYTKVSLYQKSLSCTAQASTRGDNLIRKSVGDDL